jgi:hypothetical protein
VGFSINLIYTSVGLRRIWLLDRRAPWMMRRSSSANLRSDPYLLLWFFVFLERPVTSCTRWRRRDHGDFTFWLLLLPRLQLELVTNFREFRNRFWDQVRNRYFRKKLRLLGTWQVIAGKNWMGKLNIWLTDSSDDVCGVNTGTGDWSRASTALIWDS